MSEDNRQASSQADGENSEQPGGASGQPNEGEQPEQAIPGADKLIARTLQSLKQVHAEASKRLAQAKKYRAADSHLEDIDVLSAAIATIHNQLNQAVQKSLGKTGEGSADSNANPSRRNGHKKAKRPKLRILKGQRR